MSKLEQLISYLKHLIVTNGQKPIHAFLSSWITSHQRAERMVQSDLTHMQWCSDTGLTQAGDSEVQHRGTVAAGVHYMVLVLKYQAAAFRRRTEPVVSIIVIIVIHLGAELLGLTLGKERVDKEGHGRNLSPEWRLYGLSLL